MHETRSVLPVLPITIVYVAASRASTKSLVADQRATAPGRPAVWVAHESWRRSRDRPDGTVEMHHRDAGQERGSALQAGDAFHAGLGCEHTIHPETNRAFLSLRAKNALSAGAMQDRRRCVTPASVSCLQWRPAARSLRAVDTLANVSPQPCRYPRLS